ncbi:MAG: hypothetical protein ACKVOT_13925 [Polaromonas sp.]
MAPTLPTNKPATAQLPAQIEIFRAGNHTDDSGTVHNFSQADVAGMVAAYDPKLREAPLTIGHPEHNLPAYGWVSGLAVNGTGALAMNTHQVVPQFAEMVAAKLFKKRSASFYPPSHPNNPMPGKWYLRHVAFLGAQPPAIAGLADFAAGPNEGAVNFSESSDPVAPVTQTNPEPTPEQLRMSKELQDQLAAANAKQAETDKALAAANAATKKVEDQLAQFAESALTARTAGFVSFAETQIKAGVLLPKDKDAAVAALGMLADCKPVSFSEGGVTKTISAAEWLKGFIEARKPVVSFGEHAPGSAGDLAATKGMSDAEIDAKARAYALMHKVNYSEALTAVATFTS